MAVVQWQLLKCKLKPDLLKEVPCLKYSVNRNKMLF